MKTFEMISLVWTAIMDSVEWNKKADLVGEQAIRLLNTYAKLMAAFTGTDMAQIMLINRIQVTPRWRV